MDGSARQPELETFAPALAAGGFRPGGNPRYVALASIAARVGERTGLPTIDVLRFLLEEQNRERFLRSADKFVPQLQFTRPDEPTTQAARTRANLEAIAYLDTPQIGRKAATALYKFTGWGGLKLDPVQDKIPLKYRQSSIALLHEWYTPSRIADAIADALQPFLPQLANRYGVIQALEPSAGVGRFIDSLNRVSTTNSILWTAVELNHLSATILHKLHPYTRVYNGPYEAFNRYHGNLEFDLIVANPPYGSTGDTRRYAMLDPVEAFMDSRDFAYFLKRSLHALARCGVAVFLVPRRFMTGQSWEKKLRSHVFRRAHLLAAFRLPSQTQGRRTFPSMDTVVDVVFMRSRGGILTADAPDDKGLIAGEYFEDFPKHLLGVETETSRGRYAVEGAFDRFPTFEARAECTACKAKSKPVIAVAAEVLKTQAMQFASDLGLRVKDYLASLGTGTTVISWSEIQIGLQDILLKHGNPWRWQELRDLADSGDQGAQSLLRAFTKAGQLVEALKTEPAVQPPKSDDPLILAGFLGKSGAGFTLGKLVELHQQMGGKLAADAIAKLLDEAGFLLDKDRYLPRWAYLSGDLWARYDDLPIGPEGDTRRSLLLAKIKPLVFEDIEFDPRQSWLPIEVVTGWINEDEQLNAMDVVLGRDADDFIATYDESKGVDLEALIPWLNHTRFDPVGKAPLAIDDIPDEIQQEIQRIEAGGEKIPLSIRRALWEIFWLKRFRGWLNRSEQAREIATDAYNRTFRGYALPEFDAEPIEIFRWTKDPKLQLRPHQVKAVKARVQTHGGVLALAVGAGKTFTSLAIVAVGRQQGWIKRPVIVVPRSIVWQWYEEIERVLPDYRVGVVGSTRREAKSGPRKGQVIAETASALERSTVWLDFQAGYYDLVLLTDTSIATTRISDDDMYAYNRSRMGIRRSIRLFRQQALGKHEESLTERDRAFIENGSAAWSERVLQLKGREYDPGVEWSDLGIDFLVWDETGNIRNTWTPSPGFFGDPKYMGVSRGGGAQRAWQADYRAHSVRRKGGGILGLSGTVGENSPAEPYNLLHFIDPAILEKVGINNIDQFIARYVVIEERDVVAPTGERKLKSAVVGFKNLNELRHILHTHGSFVSHEEAGIQLPDSQELLIEVKMDAHQRRRYDEWRERAQLAMEKRAGGAMYEALSKMRDITVHGLLGLGYDWNNALGGLARRTINVGALEKWQLNGWRRSLDVLTEDLAAAGEDAKPKLRRQLNRLLDKESDPDVKQVQVQKILPRPHSVSSAKFDECARRIVENQQCGHVVFVESTAAHRWLIEVLVAKGVARERIAVINGPAKPNVAKISRLFNGSPDVPRSLDVVIANSKGSRGVNLQREACMLHNLDLRWTPADMEQRRGRIDRFGNTMPVINIIFYFAKDSFDAFMFDILSGKGRWRDSLFLREGDRSINPAAQLGFSDSEILMLTARTREEGLELQRRLAEQRREEELDKAGINAVKNFQRAVGRIADAARAPTQAERERLRGEAQELIDIISKIDDAAWPWKPSLEDLWNGDPERDWHVFSAKSPPIAAGVMLQTTEGVFEMDDEGQSKYRRISVVRHVGLVDAEGNIGVRTNGSSKWFQIESTNLLDYQYTDDRANDDDITRDTVAQDWDTWKFADPAWVAKMWPAHLPTIVQSIRSQASLWVPLFRKNGLRVRASSLLQEHEADYILPPTPAAFETFQAWAPVVDNDDQPLIEIAANWFHRRVNLSHRSLRRSKDKLRFRTPEAAECNRRILEIKAPKFDRLMVAIDNNLRFQTGFHTIDLGNGVTIELPILPNVKIRDAVLRYLYRDFAERWIRLRVAQQRHLAGEVDRVLPEYYDAIERGYKRLSRVLGSANALLIQVCAQFSALDRAVEVPIDHNKLDEPVAVFLEGVPTVRIAPEVGFVPLGETQKLKLSKFAGSSHGAEIELFREIARTAGLKPSESNYRMSYHLGDDLDSIPDMTFQSSATGERVEMFVWVVEAPSEEIRKGTEKGGYKVFIVKSMDRDDIREAVEHIAKTVYGLETLEAVRSDTRWLDLELQPETVVSARGNLFIHEIRWKLDQTIPADPGVVYRIDIEDGRQTTSWAHVHPDSLDMFVTRSHYEQLRSDQGVE